ncbi:MULTISPECIES: heme ABC transporter ATP-binding protein [unclassified Haematobacter]|uniref:heme ABC transporter ATP-binding protein n=1 Tax=unclassified Haematobacter TaxID=2640585 RepID=UPI00391855CF
MTVTATLTATDITLRAGRRVILDRVSLSAPAGALTAIVGPNGSGKTTLIRALTGEVRHDGRVTLDGQDIAGLSPAVLAGLRGVLPQASLLSFPFTVREVVRLGCDAALTRPPSVETALASVGLPGFEGRFYQELSGGEQQRVQLARVLAQVWEPVLNGRPRWLFLDEPVASLDIGHQLTVMRLARDYARRGGGVVAVMHDLNLTALFADKVVLLHEGRIVAADTPRDVLTSETLSAAYGCRLRVGETPAPGVPFVLPQTAA